LNFEINAKDVTIPNLNIILIRMSLLVVAKVIFQVLMIGAVLVAITSIMPGVCNAIDATLSEISDLHIILITTYPLNYHFIIL
jgi:hypothetical protein